LSTRAEGHQADTQVNSHKRWGELSPELRREQTAAARKASRDAAAVRAANDPARLDWCALVIRKARARRLINGDLFPLARPGDGDE
jgi:hypothetical protein